MNLRALFVIVVVAIVGCGGTETDEQAAAVVPGEEAALTQSGHTISGSIGISNCNVDLRTAPFLPHFTVMKVTSSASGTYSLKGVADGSYKVVPFCGCPTVINSAGLVAGGGLRIFSPTSIGVTVSGSNVTGVNFKFVRCGSRF